MRRIITSIALFLLLAGFIPLNAQRDFGQKPVNQIEIIPYFRTDSYPEFSYAINPIISPKARIHGTSWGIDINYKISLRTNIKIKFGIGHYKYSFNKIQGLHRFGESDNRLIERYTPPGSFTPSIFFSTDNYWYNTISFITGAEKRIELSKDYLFSIGIIIRNYFSYNQRYHITYPPPSGDLYKRKDFRYFGFSGSVSTSITKKWKNFSAGPVIILPVFDYWKKDNIFFDEKNSEGRSKCLRGFGVGITCTYSLTKKR